jgi:hypothetical protein
MFLGRWHYGGGRVEDGQVGECWWVEMGCWVVGGFGWVVGGVETHGVHLGLSCG